MHSYNEVLPLMLVRYCGPGLLGLGVTALIAGFMSGMAGNVSAFSTVWTYDIYGAFINKKATDSHYVAMGRWSTLIGVLVSIGTAYLVQHAASIMDYVQALFSFFIAPLFGTVILGMLWKRATKAGGFWGLLAEPSPRSGCGPGYARPFRAALRRPLSRRQGHGREYLSGALVVDVCVVVTVVVSLLTRPRPVGELEGLVYGASPIPEEHDDHWYQKPIVWAGVVCVVFLVLNIIFW